MKGWSQLVPIISADQTTVIAENNHIAASPNYDDDDDPIAAIRCDVDESADCSSNVCKLPTAEELPLTLPQQQAPLPPPPIQQPIVLPRNPSPVSTITMGSITQSSHHHTLQRVLKTVAQQHVTTQDKPPPPPPGTPTRQAHFPLLQTSQSDPEIYKTCSLTESEVHPTEGLPNSVWKQHDESLAHVLQRLDGVTAPHPTKPTPSITPTKTLIPSHNQKQHKQKEASKLHTSFCHPATWSWRELWGLDDYETNEASVEQFHNSLALLDCANLIHPHQPHKIPWRPPTHTTTVQEWVRGLHQIPRAPATTTDGILHPYYLGISRTVVVHEIVRGNWTWSTSWSPDGSRLAVATETHELAIVDTHCTPVWKVKHDRRANGKQSFPSIRSVVWGPRWIATGGTQGVHIWQPFEPYQKVASIPQFGFVGAVDWSGEDVLAIGSRLDKAVLFQLQGDGSYQNEDQVECNVLYTMERKDWVNQVKFSPDQRMLALGDSSGAVVVYRWHLGGDDIELLTEVRLDGAVLALEWSKDQKWLYASGEDFHVSVIDTVYWELVHRVHRERWVQFVSVSSSSDFLAVGGVNSEVSILDVNNGWDVCMGVNMKGIVPLSASWHPNDEFIVLAGQDHSILAIETTNARHIRGHHLFSMSPIRSIEFSPNGQMVVVGNESGVVTFFLLAERTLTTVYELVVVSHSNITIRWSPNGNFVVVGSGDAVIVVQPHESNSARTREALRAPPCSSGFSVRKVLRGQSEAHAVSIDSRNRFVAISGTRTRILDASQGFQEAIEWKSGPHYANAWSPDSCWLATIGLDKRLTIYDTSNERVDRWTAVFSLKIDFVGNAVTWCPLITNGLLYLAYAGESREVTVMEIRANEGTWETVLRIKRDGSVTALDWNEAGLVAAALSDGTVSIIDLSYLQIGVAVNEMDYNWQRQALTCFTEIRRNRGKNCMKCVRWLPSGPDGHSLLAVGGTDGEVEILDLTERGNVHS